MPEITLVGCNVKDVYSTQTKSVTLSNSLNMTSETPGPACTRAPLSLDDDEGNNIPVDWNLSSTSFARNMSDIASKTSSSASSSTYQSTSLSSTLFSFSTSSVEIGTSQVISSVKIGTSQVLSSVEIGTSQVPKPTPGPMNKNGEWKLNVHVWMENKGAKIETELYDPNGNKAGDTKMPVRDGSNDSIEIYVESYKDRAPEHQMPFGVKVFFNNPITIDKARVQLILQKTMQGCDKIKDVPCQPNMETENKLETDQFFVDVCFQYCKNHADHKLDTWDLNCDDLNDAEWYQSGKAWKRDFNCYWHGF
jgi:hypothetical protein